MTGDYVHDDDDDGDDDDHIVCLLHKTLVFGNDFSAVLSLHLSFKLATYKV